jgi:hypothetical protein
MFRSRQAEAISEPVKPPPITSTHPARPGRQPLGQAPGVVARAQGDHSVQGGLLRLGPGARRRSGDYQRTVVGQGLAVCQQDLLADRVETGGAHPEPPVGVRVLAHRQPGGVRRRHAEQHLLEHLQRKEHALRIRLAAGEVHDDPHPKPLPLSPQLPVSF